MGEDTLSPLCAVLLDSAERSVSLEIRKQWVEQAPGRHKRVAEAGDEPVTPGVRTARSTAARGAETTPPANIFYYVDSNSNSNSNVRRFGRLLLDKHAWVRIASTLRSAPIDSLLE